MCQKLNSTQLNSTQLNSTQLNSTQLKRNLRLKSGFTLVEISIVIVIIGLIIGGVLVGRDLIRAAEIRSVLSDVEKIKSAVNTFRGKYNCLPGDCPNATAYFSGTNNGNDNGNIEFGAANLAGVPVAVLLASNVEPFYVWQHLALAALIPGQYTGVTGAGSNYESVIGQNIPASKISGGGYFMADASIHPESTVYATIATYRFQTADYSHVIEFGANLATVDPESPIITPAEAFGIDTKLDDGNPSSGTIITFPSNPLCVTTSVPSTTAYNLANAGLGCAIFFGHAY